MKLIQDPATTIRVLREQLAEARRERDDALRLSGQAASVGPATAVAQQWTLTDLENFARGEGCSEEGIVALRANFTRPAHVVDVRGGRALAHAERLRKQALSQGLSPTLTVTGPRSARVHIGPEDWRTVDVFVDDNGDLTELEALGPTIPFTKETP